MQSTANMIFYQLFLTIVIFQWFVVWYKIVVFVWNYGNIKGLVINELRIWQQKTSMVDLQ